MWCFNMSKSRLGCIDSSPFLLQLDPFRALRQSDAYTCLRLVTRESEMGPHDVILWPQPCSFYYSYRIGPHHLPRDRLALIQTAYLQPQWSSHTSIFIWVTFENSRCLWRKAIRLMGSEWVSHTVRSLTLDTAAVAEFALWALFPLYISSFPDGETCRQVDILKLLVGGSALVWLLFGFGAVVQLRYRVFVKSRSAVIMLSNRC